MKSPRRKPEKPLTKQAAEFVIHHLADKTAFHPFTGTDYDAWNAYVPLVRLWGRTRSEDVANALRAVVHSAQTRKPDVMAVFKKAIPCLLDWSDEHALWLKIGPLSPVNGSIIWPCADGPRICNHERSVPDKHHEGSFECRDCGALWRPSPWTSRDEEQAQQIADAKETP